MRCMNCNYLVYDYSEDYETCYFGFEGENAKGECGCRYRKATLDKFAKEIEEAEAEQYKSMAEFFCNEELFKSTVESFRNEELSNDEQS